MSTHKPTIYPSAIARGISIFDECQLLKEMPDGYIRVLFRILKKINLRKPTAPIFANRQTLAEESGKSIETVHRCIKWLEDRELIKRDQKAHVGLRGSSSPLVITRKLLDAILLTDNKNYGKTPVVADDNEVQSPQTNQQKLKFAKSQFERVNGITLPKDLVWLTRRGMSGPGILQLMALAKAAKQRLSDVVAATRQYLQGLNGRELYGYLRSLLSTGKDFGQKLRDAEQVARTEQEIDYLKIKAEALEGRTFVRKDGSLTITVVSGMLVEIRNGKRAARPMCQKFINAIESGRLTARVCE